ncbi:PREDICTED: ultraviolet-B receptor UVR8-like isoform X1 [Camelina sativa]|uniref:Ultraviolet-B receptor UVR8-like isoform X1 n=1 Tax=Camelina sativa TaxID=90675 RepID=A0ABM0Y0J4_CAMSA|nr:PREDICTED: ultraviolet-B receptor UVR8-like isoform X1 [Camelina sativa]
MLRLWSIAKTRIGKVSTSESSITRDVLFNGIGKRRFTASTSGERRKVMSFGDGSHGALGLSSSSIPGMGLDAYEPTLVSNLPSDISFISAGHYHSLAVTSTGDIWAWGRNNEGQLGPISVDSSRDSRLSEPKRVEGLDHVNVRAAFASGVVSAATGDDGSLWVWGRSKRGQLGLGKGIIEALVPSRVEALAAEHVVKVSLGWGHALALTVDGKVFGWGYVADGRVGNVGLPLEASLLDSLTNGSIKDHQAAGLNLEAAEKKVVEAMSKENDMPIAWEPCLVEETRNMKVADIACGSDHSLILCHDGTLLSSGSDIYGQLGRCKQDLGMIPVDINESAISVAAGLGHSLAICNRGRTKIVSWGWNRSRQLGRGKPENLPRDVEGFDEETPASVSAGRVHSLCVTEKGEAWVWGCGKNGRLGLGSSSDEPEPMLLEDVEDCVLQAAAGFDHSLILVAE